MNKNQEYVLVRKELLANIKANIAVVELSLLVIVKELGLEKTLLENLDEAIKVSENRKPSSVEEDLLLCEGLIVHAKQMKDMITL